MRLNRLVLKDFGLYRGIQEIDLVPRTKSGKTKPIVLVGGHNGAGKTTLLEAVRLCLYGRIAIGERVGDPEYHDYLRDRVHRNGDALIPTTSASVLVEFEYARSGKRSVYVVERSWDIEKPKLTEDLTVLLNGERLTEVESQFWADFVRSLIPPGLSQLFFFDGEKIQKLAQDDSEDSTLADSVKALLGLDFVERLQADLDLYVAREARAGASGADGAKLVELDEQLAKLEEQLGKARQEEAEPRTHLEHAQQEVTRLEQLLASEGHGLAGQRQELKQRASTAAARCELAARSLRELCEGTLPFSVCPNLARDLVAQLENEAKFERLDASRAAVAAALNRVTLHLTQGAFPNKQGWAAATRSALKTELDTVARKIAVVPDGFEGFTPIHRLSSRDSEDVARALTSGLSESPQTASRLCDELVLATQEKRTIQEKLNKAPDDDEIAPRVRQLGVLHKKETALQVLLSQRETSRVDLEAQQLRVKRERARLYDKQTEGDKAGTRVATAAKIRETLSVYLQQLTAVKVRQLEEATMVCFGLLCRKDDLVKSVHIDPVTFQVELGGKDGHRIKKRDLSAGEKQIYAISVLWALARVSGRPLPMIIDTPLGRLDSIHRQNLVDNYFPKASHQVIILSTDTEVDQACYAALRPQTSHAIHLKSHPGGWSEAQTGYFWAAPTGEGSHAA